MRPWESRRGAPGRGGGLGFRGLGSGVLGFWGFGVLNWGFGGFEGLRVLGL